MRHNNKNNDDDNNDNALNLQDRPRLLVELDVDLYFTNTGNLKNEGL